MKGAANGNFYSTRCSGTYRVFDYSEHGEGKEER